MVPLLVPEDVGFPPTLLALSDFYSVMKKYLSCESGFPYILLLVFEVVEGADRMSWTDEFKESQKNNH